MQSVRSFFNRALWRKNLQRFWPLWALYTLVWMLLVPIRILSELSERWRSTVDMSDVSQWLLEMGAYGGLVMAVIFGIFFAMALFSYLTSPRATQGFHAMPVRRETLYVTNYATGLVAMFSAPLLAYALGGLVAACFGLLDLGTLLTALAAALLASVFFYSFAVFCMMFTGQILAAPVFYGILNIVAVGMEYIVRAFAGNFLFGYAGNTGDLLLAPLSPVYLLAVELNVSRIKELQLIDGVMQSVSTGFWELEGLGYLAAYAVVGLVFAALGLLVYRRRASEATGSTVTVPWARPLFKYGVATCAAFSLGQLIYYLLFGMDLSQGEYSLAGTLACMLLTGLLGYFAAEMLLKKSFRVWRSGRAGALVFSAVLVLIGVAMSLDLTGYESYIPENAEIESAYVQFSSDGTGMYIDFRDAESIALVTEAHRALVADKERQLRYSSVPRDGSSLSYLAFRVSYSLKDGSIVNRRYYNCALFLDEQSEPDTVTACMRALVNCPEAARDRLHSELWSGEAGSIINGRFRMWSYNEYGSERSIDLELTAAQAQTIVEALRQDYLAGHGSQKSLFYAPSYQSGKDDTWHDFSLQIWSLETDASVAECTGIDLTGELTCTLDALRALGADIPELH